MAQVVYFIFRQLLLDLVQGLFAVSTLTIAMSLPLSLGAGRGLALGAWGAAQATAGGLGVALGGGLRDFVNSVALNGN